MGIILLVSTDTVEDKYMKFITSSLGSAKTFPGGRSDFIAFQETRHLSNEENSIKEELELEKEENIPIVDVSDPVNGTAATYPEEVTKVDAFLNSLNNWDIE